MYLWFLWRFGSVSLISKFISFTKRNVLVQFGDGCCPLSCVHSVPGVPHLCQLSIVFCTSELTIVIDIYRISRVTTLPDVTRFFFVCRKGNNFGSPANVRTPHPLSTPWIRHTRRLPHDQFLMHLSNYCAFSTSSWFSHYMRFHHLSCFIYLSHTLRAVCVISGASLPASYPSYTSSAFSAQTMVLVPCIVRIVTSTALLGLRRGPQRQWEPQRMRGCLMQVSFNFCHYIIWILVPPRSSKLFKDSLILSCNASELPWFLSPTSDVLWAIHALHALKVSLFRVSTLHPSALSALSKRLFLALRTLTLSRSLAFSPGRPSLPHFTALVPLATLVLHSLLPTVFYAKSLV